MTSTPSISVVVPTYRGAASLSELVHRLHRVLQERDEEFEVIIVNDDSPDDTRAVLREVRERFPRVRTIELLHNHGQAMATMCGLAQARGRLVATLDDDLQHPPEELPKLIDALTARDDLDAVVGSWPRDDDLWRNLGSTLHQIVDRVAYGTPSTYRHTTFRLMRRPVVDALVAHQTATPVMSPLLLQVTRRVENVAVDHPPRPYGRSTFTARHGIKTVFTNLFQGTALPLRLISRLGFATTAFAAALGIFLLIRWYTGDPPPGWTSTLLATVFFGGITIFVIGLLGEYVYLIVQEARRAPRWSIRSIDGGSTQDQEVNAARKSRQTRSTSSGSREL